MLDIVVVLDEEASCRPVDKEGPFQGFGTKNKGTQYMDRKIKVYCLQIRGAETI